MQRSVASDVERWTPLTKQQHLARALRRRDFHSYKNRVSITTETDFRIPQNVIDRVGMQKDAVPLADARYASHLVGTNRA